MTTPTFRTALAVGVALALTFTAPHGGAAQAPLPPEPEGSSAPAGPGVAILAGVASYEIAFDEAGSPGVIDGTAQVIGLSVDLPLASWLFLEPNLTRVTLDDGDAARYGGGNRHRWQVEFSFRGEFAAGPVRPYLTAGLGGFFHIDDDRPADRDFVTASYGVGAGVRLPISPVPGLEVRAEGRYRTFDDTGSTVTPLLLAVGWRF